MKHTFKIILRFFPKDTWIDLSAAGYHSISNYTYFIKISKNNILKLLPYPRRSADSQFSKSSTVFKKILKYAESRDSLRGTQCNLGKDC